MGMFEEEREGHLRQLSRMLGSHWLICLLWRHTRLVVMGKRGKLTLATSCSVSMTTSKTTSGKSAVMAPSRDMREGRTGKR